MKKIFGILTMVIIITCGCKRADKNTQVSTQKPLQQEKMAEYINDLRVALQMEDKVLRQMSEHAKQFGITWPYVESLKASRLRIMKIQSIFRGNNINVSFTPLETQSVTSIAQALEVDAKALDELEKYYASLIEKKYDELDVRLLNMLKNDVTRYRTQVEKHDGIERKSSIEYGKQKYRPR